MKCSSTAKITGMCLLLACCFASSSALAHPQRSREVHAVIESIDCQRRILKLTQAQAPDPQTLIWKSETQFLRNLMPVTVTELKKGTPVTIYYHLPFFGKPIVTKIVWVDGSNLR